MKIQKIDLYNFGSYYQMNHFDLHETDNKRVVVIGGKNGAGKTTLFTAIQVCLYGNLAFGFKVNGGPYMRQIRSLINNHAMLDDKETAFVEIEFDHVVNGEKQQYTVRRSWKWENDRIEEIMTAQRNGEILLGEEFVDFQNYLVHLIPPDLLKLYFFDGEKIADYFLGDQTINVQKALMILSGNDTFEIIGENIKRILSQSTGGVNDAADGYLEAKKGLETIKQDVTSVTTKIDAIEKQSEGITDRLKELDSAYAQKGGISLEQWTNLHNKLKEEEEKRERLNLQRKELATSILPFIILQEKVVKIEEQIAREKDFMAFQALKSKVENPGLSLAIRNAIKAVKKDQSEEISERVLSTMREFLLSEDWNGFSVLFGLSQEEEKQVLGVLQRVSQVEQDAFEKYTKQIRSSIGISKKVRGQIQKSSIDEFQDYVTARSRREMELQKAQTQKELLQEQLSRLLEEENQKKTNLEGKRKEFEFMLKQKSVSAISGRLVLLIDELEEYLFTQLISSVERDLKNKLMQLIRKKGFFDDIKIDREWNVHILRHEAIAIDDMISTFAVSKEAGIEKKVGPYALAELKKILHSQTTDELRRALKNGKGRTVSLPVEIKKEQMSSGEKQIFVMSLYWALMQQSKDELPFIIDTPFARIDAEHRKNITEKFFMELKGQLFILSTDEEISSNHLNVMEDAIAHIYMLDYGKEHRTHIREGQYFEV